MRIPTRNEVLAEVAVICKSERFARIKQGKRLLRYLVRETLNPPTRKPTIKGVVIGIEVFKKPDYDPKKHSTVKVAMRDLRKCLSEYYSGAGHNDRVIITLKKGSNVPRFKLNRTVAALDLDNQTLLLVSHARADMDQRSSIFGLSGSLANFQIWKALCRVPNHPRLLSLSAMSNALAAGSSFDTAARKRMQEAEALISQVRAQNCQPWECILTDAWVSAALHWNWKKAGMLFERANALSSGESGACHSWYPSFLASQLQFDEAEAIMQDALARSGYARTVIAADLALFQMLAGRLDDADATVHMVMRRVEVEKSEPPAVQSIAYRYAAFLSAARGDFIAAAAFLRKIPVGKADPFRLHPFALEMLFLGLAGQRDKARAGYRKLKSLLNEEYSISSFHFAMAALGAGYDDEAVSWLTEAAENRDPLMLLVAVLPFTRYLRHHSGFCALVTEKMKLNFPR
jgi:tetratricopeptide (TPR) repeat protein